MATIDIEGLRELVDAGIAAVSVLGGLMACTSGYAARQAVLKQASAETLLSESTRACPAASASGRRLQRSRLSSSHEAFCLHVWLAAADPADEHHGLDDHGGSHQVLRGAASSPFRSRLRRCGSSPDDAELDATTPGHPVTRPQPLQCLAAICSIVPIVRIVPLPSALSTAFRSSFDSLMPPFGSQ